MNSIKRNKTSLLRLVSNVKDQMSEVELTSGFRCPICSGTRVDVPEASTDSTPVSCANCNAELGTWGDVRHADGPLLSAKAEHEVKQALQSAVPDWKAK